MWAGGVLLLGHQLGTITFVQRHEGWIDYLVVLVVVVGLLPPAAHYWHGRRSPGR